MALHIQLKVLDVREATEAEVSAGSVGDSPLGVVNGSAPPDTTLH
jgi:FKBP-type peptidyl-prolyl cis-trans isomerase SlyD